jgi:hypothetical protein
MGPFSMTQTTALVAALACVLALTASYVHDRQMAVRAAEGKPWIKPSYPISLLLLATLLSIMTAVLALQGR